MEFQRLIKSNVNTKYIEIQHKKKNKHKTKMIKRKEYYLN